MVALGRRGGAAGGQQRIRQARQVRRGAQQPGDLRRLLRRRGPGQQVHPPQPGGGGLPQLGVPGGGAALGELARGGCRSAAPPAGPAPPGWSAPPACPHRPARPAAATRTAPATPTAARPPATAARPARQRPPGASSASSASHTPASCVQHGTAASSRAASAVVQRQPARAGGQGEHVLPVVAAARQARPGGDHPHRPARPFPHPRTAPPGRPAPRRRQLRRPLRRPVIGQSPAVTVAGGVPGSAARRAAPTGPATAGVPGHRRSRLRPAECAAFTLASVSPAAEAVHAKSQTRPSVASSDPGEHGQAQGYGDRGRAPPVMTMQPAARHFEEPRAPTISVHPRPAARLDVPRPPHAVRPLRRATTEPAGHPPASCGQARRRPACLGRPLWLWPSVAVFVLLGIIGAQIRSELACRRGRPRGGRPGLVRVEAAHCGRPGRQPALSTSRPRPVGAARRRGGRIS